MREMCKECLRPKATERDHEEIAEGEGEHLCWGEWSEIQCEEVAQEVTENARALCVQLKAENERLRDLLSRRSELPNFCVECMPESFENRVEWDGETLRCIKCGWDGLADDLA